jgi:hypothetical protein
MSKSQRALHSYLNTNCRSVRQKFVFRLSTYLFRRKSSVEENALFMYMPGGYLGRVEIDLNANF